MVAVERRPSRLLHGLDARVTTIQPGRDAKKRLHRSLRNLSRIPFPERTLRRDAEPFFAGHEEGCLRFNRPSSSEVIREAENQHRRHRASRIGWPPPFVAGSGSEVQGNRPIATAEILL